MSRFAALVLASVACRVEPPMPPQPPPPPPEAPKPDCTPAAVEASPIPTGAAQIVDQLDETDRAIAIIDDELLAMQRVGKLSRSEAMDAATRTIAALEHTTVGGEPAVVVELARDHQRAIEHRAALEHELGPKHPDLRRAQKIESDLALALELQRRVELEFARKWLGALTALPKTAPPSAVRDAWRTAMSASIGRIYEPSDAPHQVRIPGREYVHRNLYRDQLRYELGARHPDMLAANAAVDDTLETLHDGTTKLQALIGDWSRLEGSAISDRAAYADRARTLRAELAALAAFRPHVVDAKPGCPTPTPDPAIAQLAGELAPIDRELDALDDALIDTEGVAGVDRLTALGSALAREKLSDGLVLASVERAYWLARWRRIELDRELGPKNAEMQEAIAYEHFAEELFARQRDIDANFSHAWFHELTQLRNDQPIAVRDARLRAMRAAIRASMTADRLVPSDAPREVALPAVALIVQRLHTAGLPRELGPKHPERVAAEEALANAEADFQRGANAALAVIDRRIASTRALPLVDGGANGRRRQLVERAHELRRKLAELLRN